MEYEAILITRFISNRRQLIVIQARHANYIWYSLIDINQRTRRLFMPCIVPNLHLPAGDPCTSYLSERIARDCDCYSQSLAGAPQ